MGILVIGLNHTTADIELREKIAFNGDQLKKGLSSLFDLNYVEEAIILSTCNRVELYLNSKNVPDIANKIKLFLSDFHSIDIKRLDSSLYIYNDLEGVRHIFRVASGLDSMVLGEPQILGQVKEAFDYALSNKTTGLILNKLMKKTLSVAKRIRNETRIAENAVSISYAAVELTKKIFTDLTEKVFMLIGAGEMAELTARHLVNSGVKEIVVANRTYETGCTLARDFCGRAIKYEDFKNELIYTDIIICSTGAPNYILFKDNMERIMKERRHEPVFIIDISVPRNIDPDINHIADVYLYDIDNLQDVVDSNLHERKKEAMKAEEIVKEEILVFDKWVQSLNAVPTIVALRKAAEEIKDDELKKLLNRIDSLDENERKAIESMANSIINKLIHPPTTALKENNEDRDILINTINRLYGLNGRNS